MITPATYETKKNIVVHAEPIQPGLPGKLYRDKAYRKGESGAIDPDEIFLGDNPGREGINMAKVEELGLQFIDPLKGQYTPVTVTAHEVGGKWVLEVAMGYHRTAAARWVNGMIREAMKVPTSDRDHVNYKAFKPFFDLKPIRLKYTVGEFASNEAAILANLAENNTRAELTMLDLAASVQALQDNAVTETGEKATLKQVAEKLKSARIHNRSGKEYTEAYLSQVSTVRRNLIPELKNCLLDGLITFQQALNIARNPNPNDPSKGGLTPDEQRELLVSGFAAAGLDAKTQKQRALSRKAMTEAMSAKRSDLVQGTVGAFGRWLHGTKKEQGNAYRHPVMVAIKLFDVGNIDEAEFVRTLSDNGVTLKAPSTQVEMPATPKPATPEGSNPDDYDENGKLKSLPAPVPVPA